MKPNKMNANTQKFKNNLRQQINRYNKKLTKAGIKSEYLYLPELKNIRTKKELSKIKSKFEKTKKNNIVNKYGLKLSEKEIKSFINIKDKTNKRIASQHEQRLKKQAEIDKKWGRVKQPIKVKTDEQPIKYQKGADAFKTYKELLEFEKRLNELNDKVHGAVGEELKDRLLKAIRGETFKQANGYMFKGGKNNILADFIDKYMSTDEVEHFFGGKLNFQFVYSPQEGIFKEIEIVEQIINNNEYPKLKEKWLEEGGADQWKEFMQESLDNIENEELQDDVNEFFQILDDI